MHRLDGQPARFVRILFALWFALPLVGACADILGFEEGKPYPPDAGAVDAEGGSAPLTPDTGSCQNGTCDCPTGTHACGNSCVNSSDPETCGTSCSACLPPNGGDATCDGTKCGVSCPNGQKPCAGTCIPMQNTCVDQCLAMTHDCGGACASNTSVNSCGTSCSPCNVPPAGQATCDGTTCGIQCNPTFKPCGNQCIPTTGCCMTAECPMNSTCSGNQCQCSNGFKLCQGSCIPTAACCTDGECQANAACIGNQCQCKSTFKGCNDACIPDGSCCTSDDCTNGYLCSGNTCQCQLPNIVCQARCLNGATDTNNCGACGHVCPLGCTLSQCTCATPDRNQVPNGGFDSDFSHWTFPPGTLWSNNDAVQCPSSGSVHLTTTSVLPNSEGLFANYSFPVSPGPSPYLAGLRARKVGAASGSVSVNVAYWSGALLPVGVCDGSKVVELNSAWVDVGTDWTIIAAPATATISPACAYIAMFFAKTDQVASPFELEVDMVYVTPSPGTGWQ